MDCKNTIIMSNFVFPDGESKIIFSIIDINLVHLFDDIVYVNYA